MKKDMEELYNCYFPAVYKYLFSISQDKHIAEELTQETFFKALQKIDLFRGECDIRVWLCQIGKNTYQDYLRKNKRLSAMEDMDEAVQEKTPEAELLQKENIRQLHGILHRLQEPYKEVFSLRIFGELTFREISELFEKSESWAKMTYLRAKRKIQEEMKNE